MVDQQDEDPVGFKRPPKATQFKPGQSGNPKGRPKNARNLKTEFLDELGELIRVREGGRELRISKQRAFVKSLVAAAIKGDMRATTALVSFCTRAFAGEPESGHQSSPTTDDLEILNEYVGREVRRRAASGTSGNSQSSPSTRKRKNDKR